MAADEKDKQPRIFYGWYILGIGMMGVVMAAGTSQLFMSIMLKPLTAEFGWSRTAATGAITAGTLMAGIVSIVFGRLADRYGPRLLTSLGAVATAGIYLALTRLADLWHFYVVYIVGRVVASNTMAKVVPNTAVVNWFRRMRGRALGLLAMASPLGSSLLAITGQYLIEHHGWRSVFYVFAGAILVLVAMPAVLMLRRRPEDMGLQPDGGSRSGSATSLKKNPAEDQEYSWKLKEAIRTPALWLIISAIVIALSVNAGIGFHQVAYYTDVGIAATAAVVALSIYALSGAFANAIWGFLTEQFSERLLASLVMLLTAAAILYLQTIRSQTGAITFAIFFGLTSRGEDTLVNIILAQYYGRDSYGAIAGFVYPFHMLGLGLGPIVASVSFDLTGSYHAVFSFFVFAAVAASACIWFAKKPVPPAGSQNTPR
ncbi:MAG: MFS transporter [Thermodesulfobacteriota bacterium]